MTSSSRGWPYVDFVGLTDHQIREASIHWGRGARIERVIDITTFASLLQVFQDERGELSEVAPIICWGDPQFPELLEIWRQALLARRREGAETVGPAEPTDQATTPDPTATWAQELLNELHPPEPGLPAEGVGRLSDAEYQARRRSFFPMHGRRIIVVMGDQIVSFHLIPKALGSHTVVIVDNCTRCGEQGAIHKSDDFDPKLYHHDGAFVAP